MDEQRLSLDEAMRLAIAEGYKGAPYVSPNPLVGCVILDAQGRLLSKGYHAKYGGPHAEVNALAGLSLEQLQGAHVIVTLEPCAHEGKTPSCAKALAKLPIAKVTFGLVDPNPLVAGQGAAILKAAGIPAEVYRSDDNNVDSQMVAELEQLCENFLYNFRHKKIFVALKMASSLDGQLALKSGESQWITGEESRQQVHYLRAIYDAVLVGKNTVLIDNPSLNVRHPEIVKENKVVLIDPEGQLLSQWSDLKISKTHPAENIFICIAQDFKAEIENKYAGQKNLPQIVFVSTRVGGDLDLPELLTRLYEKGLRSLMVEGGAMTASQFLQEKLVQRVWLFQAPVIIGAGGGKAWSEGFRIEKMADRLELEFVKTQNFGRDIMWTGRLH